MPTLLRQCKGSWKRSTGPWSHVHQLCAGRRHVRLLVLRVLPRRRDDHGHLSLSAALRLHLARQACVQHKGPSADVVVLCLQRVPLCMEVARLHPALARLCSLQGHLRLAPVHQHRPRARQRRVCDQAYRHHAHLLLPCVHRQPARPCPVAQLSRLNQACKLLRPSLRHLFGG